MGYPIQTAVRATPQQKKLTERAESLSGLRDGQDSAKRAVTVEDVQQLGTVKLLSAKATAAPTMDQYNALVADVQAIARLLNAMGAKFTGF